MKDKYSSASTTSLSAKLFYGLGAVAYGIKDNGFAFLLLIYYSQVLGLPQAMVGGGIFLALFIDALTDPLVGSVSDNLNTRWGRRHPFMYFAALPIAVLYYFLWAPPTTLSNDGLFWYFLAMAILVRISITFYEIPSSALVAELTNDYHERTIFISLRHLFAWSGGLSLSVYAYGVLLVPTEEFPIGVLNPAGYQTYGLVASILMLTTMWISALGTHRYIPHLRKSRQATQSNLPTIVRQTIETLKNKSFAAIFISAFFAALAAGLVSALSVYFNTFYWELDNSQIAVMVSTLFVAATLSALAAPVLGRRFGKKIAAVGVGACAACLTPLPFILRSLGLFPDNGTDTLFYTLMSFQLVDVTLIITSAILIDSMIADIVEQSELLTGRRSEGVFFAARNFVRKSVSGVGVLLATVILSAINFPTDAVPGSVAPEVIFDLGLLYAPAIFILYTTSILILLAYRITKEIHEENLQQLLKEADNH